MQGIIELKNPIKIDGKPVSELKYDTNEITVLLYAEAETRKKIAGGSRNVTITVAAEFDCALHLYAGIAAVVAVNEGYTFNDLERIHGVDVIKLSEVGRTFLLKSEGAAQSNSDAQSETIPEPTTQAPPTSKESE